MFPKPRKLLCRRVSAPSVQYVPVHKAENSGRKRVQLGRAHNGPVGARGGGERQERLRGKNFAERTESDVPHEAGEKKSRLSPTIRTVCSSCAASLRELRQSGKTALPTKIETYNFTFKKMGYQEEKQRQLDIRYLRMARIWAENSYCVRRKVGALIVKDKMIISDGYNGTPSGFENICEDETGKTKSYVLHAEANAITKVAKSANNCDGSTLYITAAPCIECSKLIIQAGIRRVVYCDEYRSEEGLDLLRKVGIECVQREIEE